MYIYLIVLEVKYKCQNTIIINKSFADPLLAVQYASNEFNIKISPLEWRHREHKDSSLKQVVNHTILKDDEDTITICSIVANELIR